MTGRFCAAARGRADISPVPTNAVTAPAPATGRVTRDQLFELGRSGRPWPFLAVASPALAAAPHDAGLRFLTAANLARLGLATAARQLLGAMGPEVAGEPQVAELSRAIEQLPAEGVPAPELIETCRCNLETLAGRGVDLRAEFDAWTERLATVECFRAVDGNIVRRVTAGDGRVTWTGLADQRGEAERFVADNVDNDDPNAFLPPYVLEGLDPPWLLAALVERTPPTQIGYQPRITVLQADAMEALDGLALADVRPALADPRVTVLIGPDAGERLRADPEGTLKRQALGEYVLLPTVRRRLQPPVQEILQGVQAQQQETADRLGREVRGLYAGRDGAWWARRYAEARNGTGPPLRVLLPTTRFSTYIQYASCDLAAAFERAGCRVDVLLEPDAFTKLSSITYLGRLKQVEPDLVVLINYSRANTAELFPPQLPFVCWIQDAMWQQLTDGIGAMQTPRDFLVGQLWPELFERFGYRRRNTLAMPNVVSPRKFHDGEVDDRLRDRHRCEIAYVSHQSETPEKQRDRILRALRRRPELHRCVEAMYPRLADALAGMAQMPPALRLAEIVEETLLAVAGGIDPHAATQVLKLWVQPLADRLLRHESLQWAAEIAQRRGWRFRLYGRGWQEHPRLGRFAAGELGHGEELRACYQAAAVHLHMTVNTNRHQRVLECALSGGLPVFRRNAEDLWPILDYTLDRIVGDREADVGFTHSRKLGFSVVDHPAAMAYTAALQRYGLRGRPYLKLTTDELAARRDKAVPSLDHDDAWLFGDPADITFSTAAELETLIERAVERPAWRGRVSRGIAHRIRGRYTTDCLARRIIDMVTGSFEGPDET